MRHPPGPRGRETLQFVRSGSLGGMLLFLESMARRYGPLSSFRFLTKRIYLVDDPELAREILVTRQHEFVRDSGATLLRELVGDGLLTREEPLHKERRRILQPAFHRDQIASYTDAMVRASADMSNGWTGRSSIDPRREMRKLTLSIVGATLFGADFSNCTDQVAEVVERVVRKSSRLAPLFAFVEPLALGYRRIFPHGPSLLFQSERTQIERILAPVIQQRRVAPGRDILSLILNQQDSADQPLSNESVRNEIVTFVLAGHETTATALTWTWYLLAEHTEVAGRLHEELDDVLRGRDPSLEDLPKLTYTGMVFKEALRLYPSALLFGRRPKQTLQLAGFTIRTGESIFLSPYITQRNPANFSEPDKFIPERWSSAESPRFSYFPFGGGAKSCIGEFFARTEGTLVLATLARRWQLRRSPGTPCASQVGPVLTPAQSVPLQIETRQRLGWSVSA